MIILAHAFDLLVLFEDRLLIYGFGLISVLNNRHIRTSKAVINSIADTCVWKKEVKLDSLEALGIIMMI